MKLYFAVLTTFILGLSACQEKVEIQDQALVITPENIEVGQDVSISYDDSKTNLAGIENIEGVVYFWQDWHWIANDIQLKKKNGLWKTTLKVPENAGLLAFKFVADGEEDCGGSMWSYVQLTQDSTGINLPNAYVAWGMLRNGLFKDEYGIPGYVEDSTLIGNDVMLYWCNQELQYHPAERKDVMYYAAKTINALDKKESLPVVRKDVQNLMALDSVIHEEKYLARGIEIAQTILHDNELANTLEEYALATYPNGIVARDKDIWSIFRMADAEEKELAMAAFVKKYPYKDWKDTDTQTSLMYLGKNFQSVVYMPVIKRNDYSLLDTYLHELPYDYLYTFFWHMVQIPYRNGQLTAEQVLPQGQKLIDEAFNRERTISQLVYSPKEWGRYLLNYRKDALLDWSMILHDLGSDEKAMEWMTKIEPYFEGKETKFSSFYVQILIEAGHKEQALEVIKRGLANNAASPEMLQILEADYIAKNGSDKGFNSYVHSLKSVELTNEQQAHLNESIVDLPIELFELETLDGQKLNMADYKGKTIVLDFWATWCAPCKAAMPGMNMVYQQYKDDKNVAFFFISTMEFKKDYKDEIKQFIKDKGYDFNVLLDVPNAESKKRDYVYTQYAKAFGFSGIPQKIIIGPNGNLRWRSTGYEGSPTALADEITYLIEYLRKI